VSKQLRKQRGPAGSTVRSKVGDSREMPGLGIRRRMAGDVSGTHVERENPPLATQGNAP
jgi:hypothetical protein